MSYGEATDVNVGDSPPVSSGLAREAGAVKTIGLLGGMSWESSIEYERLINTEVRRRLGGAHSADLIIRSYDFAAIEELQERGDWDAAGAILAADAAQLQQAGAELIVLCTNTMHRLAPTIEAALRVPFLHIADATIAAVVNAGIERVALLGTRYTMEQDFYRGRLEQAGLEVRVPDPAGRDMVHRVIFEELVQGEVRLESRRQFVDLIEQMVGEGAEGVIAGCTEIELLVGLDDVPCPYFPTTSLHALAAVEAALA
jgi:aspartate racemase